MNYSEIFKTDTYRLKKTSTHHRKTTSGPQTKNWIDPSPPLSYGPPLTKVIVKVLLEKTTLLTSSSLTCAPERPTSSYAKSMKPGKHGAYRRNGKRPRSASSRSQASPRPSRAFGPFRSRHAWAKLWKEWSCTVYNDTSKRQTKCWQPCSVSANTSEHRTSWHNYMNLSSSRPPEPAREPSSPSTLRGRLITSPTPTSCGI